MIPNHNVPEIAMANDKMKMKNYLDTMVIYMLNLSSTAIEQ